MSDTRLDVSCYIKVVEAKECKQGGGILSFPFPFPFPFHFLSFSFSFSFSFVFSFIFSFIFSFLSRLTITITTPEFDSYATVKMNGREVFRTRTVFGTNNPFWDEEYLQYFLLCPFLKKQL